MYLWYIRYIQIHLYVSYYVSYVFVCIIRHMLPVCISCADLSLVYLVCNITNPYKYIQIHLWYTRYIVVLHTDTSLCIVCILCICMYHSAYVLLCCAYRVLIVCIRMYFLQQNVLVEKYIWINTSTYTYAQGCMSVRIDCICMYHVWSFG